MDNSYIKISDKITLWLSQHYMAMFNFFVFLYLGLAFAAPVLMKVGLNQPAFLIYRAYGLTCHQLAFRSWFLFGEQAAYPRSIVHIDGWSSFEDRLKMNTNDIIGARNFIGDDGIGYKIALCQRDVAIYGGLLIFGLIFSMTKNRIFPLRWELWILLGIVPIAIDGVSQIISQLPIPYLQIIIPYRESTPLLRTITGFLFGFCTGWFAYPIVEISMRDSREHLMQIKDKLIKSSITPTQSES